MPSLPSPLPTEQSKRRRLRLTVTTLLSLLLFASITLTLTADTVPEDTQGVSINADQQQFISSHHEPNLDVNKIMLQATDNFPLSLFNAWTSDDSDNSNIVAWGDVDGDGDLDLAVSNVNQPNTVYLNEGGVLQTVASWESGANNPTRAVAWGDIDGDGDLDLAAGNEGVANRVYLNEEGVLQKFAEGSGDSYRTFSVAWGDVDGDGDLDLATGNFEGANVVYLNEGGVLQKFADSPWTSDDTDRTFSVAWGDVDGDGDLDLAAGNEGVANKVYLNENGVLQTAAYWTSDDSDRTYSVAWGDVDGDGDLDLAVGNRPFWNGSCYCDGGGNKVYLNEGGVLQTAASWSSNDSDETFSVTWGDVDGDGDLDLAVGNQRRANKVYLNDEGVLQTAADSPWDTGDNDDTRSVAWGDVDGDGDLDLVASNPQQAKKLYLNAGGGLQTAANTPWRSSDVDDTRTIAWGDVDGDGDLDLAAGNIGANKVYLNQAGVLQPATDNPWRSDDSDNTYSIIWGDVDGDGDLDLAAANAGGVGNKVYFNEGGILQTLAGWSSGDNDNTHSAAWGDVDGDGDLDLAVGNLEAVNKLYLNENGVLQTAADPLWLSDDDEDTRHLAWGDVDGDGDLDLAVGNTPAWTGVCHCGAGGTNKLYLNEGGILQTTAGWSSNDFDETYSVAWGDADGDGDLDLAVGNFNAANKIYFNEGGVLQATAGWSSDDSDNTRSLVWGDADGDGDLDLAAGNEFSANVVYLNERGVLQTAADNLWNSGDNNDTRGVAWGDVDGDGDLDLAVGNRLVSNLVHLNGKGAHDLPITVPFLTISRPITPAVTNFYVPPQLLEDNIIPISYTLFDHEANSVGQIRGEYSLNGGGQWFPAIATSATPTTNLAASAWPTGTEHIYHWDAFASGFFGQSDNVVFRLEVSAQPAVSGNAGEFSYPNNAPFPIQRPYASATTFPFRVSGTQVQVFNETVGLDNEVADVVIFRQPSGTTTAEVMTSNSQQPFTTDNNGYLSGRGTLSIGDQLFAALPVTTTYRTPPQILFGGEDGVGEVVLNSSPNNFTAELWLRPFSHEGIIISDSSTFTLANPSNIQLTFGNITTSTEVGLTMGAPHHLAVSWQASNGAWVLYLDGTAVANGTAAGQSLDLSTLTFASGYNGFLDEIRLWGEARTPAQITDNFASELDGGESGLLGYWPVGVNDALAIEDVVDSQTMSISGGAILLYKPLYTLYHTNSEPTINGLSMFEVGEPGVQTLAVSENHPLLLFDLDISLEWDASNDTVFLDQLETAIQQASATLYDVTNGQMALGKVVVYHSKQNWLTADVAIQASNDVRPSAVIGGVVSSPVSDEGLNGEIPNAFVPGQIRMGPSWNPFGQTTTDLDQAWWQAFAHELGHYLLFLPDNYLGLDDGRLITTDCFGSFMTNATNDVYSEFLTADGWNTPECARTIAAQTTGRNDWQTILKYYPFLYAPNGETNVGPTTLPLAVTNVFIDQPEQPTATFAPRIFELRGETDALVSIPDGKGYLYKTQGTIDIGDDRLLKLGSVNTTGQFLPVRGAEAGDRLCVMGEDNIGTMIGCEMIDPFGSVVEMVGVRDWNPQIQIVPNSAGELTVEVMQPLGAGEVLYAQVFPTYEPLSTAISAPFAELIPSGADTYSAVITAEFPIFAGSVRVWVGDSNGVPVTPYKEAIVPYTLGEGFEADQFLFGADQFLFGADQFLFGADQFLFGADQFLFGADQFLFGADQFLFGADQFLFGADQFVFGADQFLFGADQFLFGADQFLFGGNEYVMDASRRPWGAPVSSPNREVTIINSDDPFDKTGIKTIQELSAIPQLDSWLAPVGTGYRVELVEEAAAYNRSISFQYLTQDVPAGYERPEFMNIYFSSDNGQTWQVLPTSIDVEGNFAIAKLEADAAGLYILAVTVPINPSFVADWNAFGYPLADSQPITQALASIDGKYTAVATPPRVAQDDWLFYYPVIEAPFEGAINTLEVFEFTQAYWIHMEEPATLFLNPAVPSQARHTADMQAQQQPPAVFYGWITPTDQLQPQVGDVLTAWVDGMPCGETAVVEVDGRLGYVVQVAAAEGEGAVCGQAEKLVEFRLSGQVFAERPLWENGTANFVPLAAVEKPIVYLPFVITR